MDFPVHGREDVRCLQIETGDTSGFPYFPELLETNLAVELWNVGPQYEEQILDFKYFEANADLRQGQNYWWPTDCTNSLVWIVYKTFQAYKDATMTDDDNYVNGTGKEFQHPVVHHVSSKAVSAQEGTPVVQDRRREYWFRTSDVGISCSSLDRSDSVYEDWAKPRRRESKDQDLNHRLT